MQMQVMTHTQVVGSRVLGFRVDLAVCPCAPRASGRLVAVLFFQTPCAQWNVPQAEFRVGAGII